MRLVEPIPASPVDARSGAPLLAQDASYFAASARIDSFQAAECTFEGEEILDRHCRGLRRVQEIIEFDVREASSSFLTLLMATVIHEHAPHGLRGQRESLRAARQCGTALLLQPKPGLVHQRGGLQCVIRSLASEVSPRHAPQLVVHERKVLLNRSFR